MKNNRWMAFATAGLLMVGFSQFSFASGNDLATCKVKGTDLRVLIEFYIRSSDGSMEVSSAELARVVGKDSFGDEELVTLGSITEESGKLSGLAKIAADKKSVKISINAVDTDENLFTAYIEAKQTQSEELDVELKGRVSTTLKKANATVTAEYPNLKKAKIECTYN